MDCNNLNFIYFYQKPQNDDSTSAPEKSVTTLIKFKATVPVKSSPNSPLTISPSKRLKPKRKVFLKQNIFHPTETSPEKSSDRANIENMVVKEDGNNNQISQYLNYLNEANSTSENLQDDEYLDINVSDNLNLSLA